MHNSFDTQIDDVEKRLERLKKQMSDAREAWLDELAPRIAAFWEKKVEAVVTAEADQANELGLEALSGLKAQLKDMTDAARSLAKSKLVEEQPKLWPDLAPQVEPYDRAFSSGGPSSGFRLHDFYFEETYRGRAVEGPDLLKDPVSRFASEVNLLLRPLGFEAGMTRRGQSIPEWSWDEELAQAINGYADLHDEYVAELRNLKKIREEKARAEAKSLWDQA